MRKIFAPWADATDARFAQDRLAPPRQPPSPLLIGTSDRRDDVGRPLVIATPNAPMAHAYPARREGRSGTPSRTRALSVVAFEDRQADPGTHVLGPFLSALRSVVIVGMSGGIGGPPTATLGPGAPDEWRSPPMSHWGAWWHLVSVESGL